MFDGDTPQLPKDPALAAQHLLEMFQSRGRWSKGKSWEELTETERTEIKSRMDAFDVHLGWLGEAMNSEMVYSQRTVPTNEFGNVYCFRFWLQYDGPHYDEDLNGYIVFSDQRERPEDGILFWNNGEGWRSVPLAEAMQWYHDFRGY